MKKTLLIVAFLLLGAAFAQQARQVYINRVQLADSDVYALETVYRTILPDGYYWYDAVSGLFGFEGGPTLAQIFPGLALGGPLAANASGQQGMSTGTGIFINGRELHGQEANFLVQLYGAALPGRYWLDAFGNVGFEGMPVLTNLFADSQAALSARGGGVAHSEYGSTYSDGQGFTGFMSRDVGGGVISVTCGPDGGCIY